MAKKYENDSPRKFGWKPKAYTPETLWQKFKEYREWVKENPLKSQKTFMYQGEIVKTDEPRMRIMSIEGFCVYADIVRHVFYDYEAVPDGSYLHTCKRIRDEIDAQNLEGGSAGLLDAMIVVRKLGLKEKTDMTTDGEKINVNILPHSGQTNPNQ